MFIGDILRTMKMSWYDVQRLDYRDFGNGLGEYRELFYKKVPKDKRILDVGCGNGYFLADLREHGYEDILGIDIIPQAITDTGNRGIKALLMNAHKTEFEDNDFDVITGAHVIEHSPKPAVFLNELKRILKPDGLLFIEIPLETEPTDNRFSGHFTFWNEKEKFIKFIKSSGLKIIQTGGSRWFWVLCKK